MLGDVGVERVRRQQIAAADELETIGRHDQMQEAVLTADGAVAVRDLDIGRRRDLEAHATAMTASGVYTHTRKG